MPDYPDYHYIVRNVRGKTYKEDWSIDCPPYDITTCFNITGRGFVYGGYLYTDDPDINIADVIRVSVDGELITAFSWEFMYKYNFTTSKGLLVSLNYYDPVDHIMSACFADGVTFDQSYKIQYFPHESSHIWVYGHLIYTLI